MKINIFFDFAIFLKISIFISDYFHNFFIFKIVLFKKDTKGYGVLAIVKRKLLDI